MNIEVNGKWFLEHLTFWHDKLVEECTELATNEYGIDVKQAISNIFERDSFTEFNNYITKRLNEEVQNESSNQIMISQEIIFNRVWEMPNSNTFDIRCINKLIMKYLDPKKFSIDPFANKNRLATVTNDLDPDMKANHCMDALDFIKTFPDKSVDMVLYDPPYSPRQVSECYKKLGRTVDMKTTQASFWGNLKKEITRVIKPGGIVISFAWNSNGIGKTKGFAIREILLVAHGGAHNDTICVVEQKIV